MYTSLSIKDDQYPTFLKRLSKPPQNIFYEGKKDLLAGHYISVVGARDIQPWVSQWMEFELLAVLKKLSVGIISGGARGVDQSAHSMSLRAQVPTLVVLPSGLNRKYPKNIERFEGDPLVGFISEYEGDVSMRKHFFYNRNRLIAALSKCTLVLQASERSGTMITAKYSLDLGNNLATLPANPLDPRFHGNNQLIFDGASMVRNQKDLEQFIVNSIFF